MEKQKRWQFALIITVLALTLYNILPTLFFYAKPLNKPIDEKSAFAIASEACTRINDLEAFSEKWLRSYCKSIGSKPLKINIDPKDPQIASITFSSSEDAARFSRFLPRAGSLISFVPAQLALAEDPEQTGNAKTVLVKRRIPLHFTADKPEEYFQFSFRKDAQGAPTPLYRAVIEDRLLQLGIALGGNSENAELARALIDNPQDPRMRDIAAMLAENINSFTQLFGQDSALAKRYFASFTQLSLAPQAKRAQIDKFAQSLESVKSSLRQEKVRLEQSGDAASSTFVKQQIEVLSAKELSLTHAIAVVKNQVSAFSSGQNPWTYATMEESLKTNRGEAFDLHLTNPFIQKIIVDWVNDRIVLAVYPDFLEWKQRLASDPQGQNSIDQADQLLFNQIASVTRLTDEKITPFQGQFTIAMNALGDTKSFLVMRLASVARAEAEQIRSSVLRFWHPTHPDLQADSFPIWDYATYNALPAHARSFGLLIYSPAAHNQIPPAGMRMNSVYVVAKGVEKMLANLRADPNSEQSQQFVADFQHLQQLLQKEGFYGYPGKTLTAGSDFGQDYIFEQKDYYQDVLKATRENFSVLGTKRFAILEFSNLEQRILTENKIDTRIHEDLLKWRDDYNAAQLGIKGTSPYDIAPPIQNVYLSNAKLSAIKYFRGDERKILHWGLDLSGGKTVQLELRDANNRLVTDENDLRQGINELYQRVNKMGVSEVSIRQEGNAISLDFPGSQSLSATELVKASTMYFHVVNEKFSQTNPSLAEHVRQFLQDIWNEAVVTNQTTIEDINRIAWQHIHGDSMNPEVVQPRSESARLLYEQGLFLAAPNDHNASSFYDTNVSKIAEYRGDDFTDWHGQTHPLLIVFRNYALEGANLDNVNASYDPSKGNFLSFTVKGSQANPNKAKSNPREDLRQWTGAFSREKIAGTPLESYSEGKGWRMAVVLNGSVISAPTLDSPLSDSAMITGSFTQREVNQLEADLKAGSLTFTPRILSEKNVSPELGNHERTLGILGMVLSLLLVAAVMIGYYRFSGVVATAAVFFNLLIMWATLQNLGATLTLAGIAGIILTVGMAVDANVLVFERIREEFAKSGRIASALQAGYKKAFTAIFDSNITTLIAALILLNFDSGPIKGLALTLIIGLVSSMFTALFMTRYFFAGWVENPRHKELKMYNWFKARNFNFLKYTKTTLLLSVVVILVGVSLTIIQRHTFMGMDFTGGYALSMELQPTAKDDYRGTVEKALLANGIAAQDFQVRELNPSNHVRIFLSKSIEEAGHPFYQLPLEYEDKEPTYPYQTNPRIVWVVNALQKGGIGVSSLQTLDQNWIAISGQMSDTMRTHALIGLGIALLCILGYITFRFEFSYAISATICILHDVVFTVGMMAILHWLGVPVQIDLHTVAALLTIVGYSLNDTIIVFDRIREDMRLKMEKSLPATINHALNVTLSRTVLTSGTTLLVLLPLVALGGSTIFSFALVMAIGVVFGTLSSLFIAAPLMLYFHNREQKKHNDIILNHSES